MKLLLRIAPHMSIAGLVLLAACGGSSESTPAPGPTVTATPATNTGAPVSSTGAQVVNLSLENHGGSMEGHTPRGFQGMGTGLFAGDNLNRNFPNGDGVQIFLTFDLSDVPPGKVQSAVLSSGHASVSGTPFKDLGALTADEIRYSGFSSSLWDLSPVENGANCILAESAAGPFQCDLSGAVQRSLDDSYQYAQFRIRLETAGDSDSKQDLVAFFKRDSNTNEPGIFLLDVTVTPN